MPFTRLKPVPAQRAHAGCLLGVAFIGFSPDAQAQMLKWIEPLAASRHAWYETTLDMADAVCVHEGAVESSDSFGVKLRSATGASATVRTDKQLRPVAVATARADIPGCWTFDAASQSSVMGLFRGFETRLGGVREDYAMGAVLAAHPEMLETGGVYHLVHEGRLVAIADTPNRIFGARPPVHASVLQAAEWRRRPEGAAGIPTAFASRSYADLLWTYASRASRPALPPGLRTGRLSLVRLPPVPVDRLNSLQVKILSALQRQSLTLDELLEQVGGSMDAVGRCVGALHDVGSLSLSTPQDLGTPPGRLDAIRRFLSRDAGVSFFASARVTARNPRAIPC